MKWISLAFIFLTIMVSCNNGGESGVVNDGDSATRRNRDVYPLADPATDTSRGEHRVDIQQRDSQ
ncbi:MAG: hypothetical protein ACXWV0_10570 [Flavisolibacter sp.]